MHSVVLSTLRTVLGIISICNTDFQNSDSQLKKMVKSYSH